MPIGTNQAHVSAFNRRVVLNAIRLHGPLSRADISRLTALTNPAVSSIVESLVTDGLVCELGPRQSKRGKPPIDLGIDPEGAFGIGLNLNRDSLIAGLIDLGGKVRKILRVSLEYPQPSVAIPLMKSMVRELNGLVPLGRLGGIGIGFPGPIHRESKSVRPINFAGWEDVHVADLVAAGTDAPVFLENNATAAAIGEHWYGVGRTIPDYFYVFFGVGVGGGIIAGGEPFTGSTGNAARLGTSLVTRPDGSLGILDKEASLATVYAYLQGEGLSASTPEQLSALAAKDEPRLWAALDRVAAALVLPLANAEGLLDPEAIVFGGRMPKPLLEYLIDALGAKLATVPLETGARRAKLVVAEAGDEAAALGVATLPLYEAFAPSHDLVVRPSKSLV